MRDRHLEDSEEFDRHLREWSRTEPATGDAQIRGAILDRLPERRSRTRVPLALAAAAASVAALLIGLQSTRQPPTPHVFEVPEVVYEVGDNVILVLRDDGPPIYVLTEPTGVNGATP